MFPELSLNIKQLVLRTVSWWNLFCPDMTFVANKGIQVPFQMIMTLFDNNNYLP